MGTMKDVIRKLDEAMFRGMGAVTDNSAKARAKMDAARAAKRRGAHEWAEDSTGDGGVVRLIDAYKMIVGEVRWFDIDESKDRFVASVKTPGVRGNPTQIGRFTSLDKAKAAVMKELGL